MPTRQCSTPYIVALVSRLGVAFVMARHLQKESPPPPDNTRKPLRALIFDSYYDAYKAMPCLPICTSHHLSWA